MAMLLPNEYARMDTKRSCSMCLSFLRRKRDIGFDRWPAATLHREAIKEAILAFFLAIAIDNVSGPISLKDITVSLNRRERRLFPVEMCISGAIGDLELEGRLVRLPGFVPGTKMSTPNQYRVVPQ